MSQGAPTAPAAAPVRRLGALFGAVVAPTSFVSALLYYFGYWHVYWFFAYFGVNSTVLDFGTVDYLMRSLDALFIPMVVVAAGGLAAFWGHDLLRTRITAGPEVRLLRYALPTVAAIGLLLTLGGLYSVADRQFFLNHHLVAAPLSLASGVILLAYTLHLYRTVTRAAPAGGPTPPTGTDPPPEGEDPTPPPSPAPRPEWATLAEWAVVFVLIGLGLIWAANDYAAAVGRGRAQQLVDELPYSDTTVLYSDHSLSLTAPGVRETRCRNADSAYHYRYDGLVLILQSANQYVLILQSWTPSTGVALVLPRSDAVRLEFAPYGSRGSTGRSPAC
ncbi:hypothetical protein ACIBCO_31105 [Streptomyces violascens]|uniref:hypothetical protein n=1 Tax=Streptomyces violascens TaxID=67381 RepID=UPI00379B8A1F